MSKILLVDDQPDVLATLARALERLGHQVVQANDGRQALRALRAEPCDLVMTDINMPEMDGIELIMALRSERRGIPIIAMSGGGKLPKELLLSSAGALGAVYTLEKPVGIPELMDALGHALEPPTTPDDR